MRQALPALQRWAVAQLNTFWGRYVTGALFVLTLWGLMKWQRDLVGLLIFIGISIAAIWSIVARLRVLTPLVRVRLLRRFGRFLRATRAVTTLHPAVEVLQLVAVLCTFVVMCYLLLTKDIRALGWVWSTLSAILIAAALIDIPCQLRAVMKLAWAKTLGKLLLGIVGTLSLILATSEARDLAHQITKVDPKNFPDFQSLAIFVLTPAYYVKIVASVLALWAALNLLVGMASYGVLEVHATFRRTQKQPRGTLAFRLVNGKRPPPGYTPPSFSWGGFLFFMRNIAIVLAVSSGEAAFQGLGTNYRQSVDRAMQIALVSLDFRSDVSCADRPASARAAYLDQGGILVATSGHDGYQFTIVECPSKSR